MLRISKGLFMSALLTLACALQLLVSPVHAEEVDEDLIRQLVRQEVERLLHSEGALDVAIEKGIKDFILKQRVQADAQKQQMQADNLRPVDPYRDHIFGNPDAPITLVEYSDFECPYCKYFHPTVIQLIKNNRHKLRWVYRHFPLDFHNPGAQKQAEASECVAELNGNDSFWAYSNSIYQRTKSNGEGFPIKKLRPLAEEIGVNGDAFSECLDSGRMTARVREDYENGVNIGVSGTPVSVFINRQGEVRSIAGAVPLDKLQALIDDLAQ